MPILRGKFSLYPEWNKFVDTDDKNKVGSGLKAGIAV